jgi:peroxiredoxin Q/BCP
VTQKASITLREGDSAPDIRLETDSGDPFQLSSLAGRKVILYFYPKADTPGCTTEACGFRDEAKLFGHQDAVIVGVSPDRAVAQARFKTKYGLPFTLLCDVDKKAAEAYGVLKKKNMYGRTVLGIERTTFLIGEDGRIMRIFQKVRPQGHAQEVLSALA